MDNFEIMRLLRHVCRKKSNVRVITRKSLKSSLEQLNMCSLPICIAINMINEKEEAIGHWTMLYIKSKEGRANYTFFDSYGISFHEYMSVSLPNLQENSVVLQSNSSSRCGEFVVFVASLLVKNKSLKDIVSRFSPSKILNDKIVRKYVNSVRRSVSIRQQVSQKDVIFGSVCKCSYLQHHYEVRPAAKNNKGRDCGVFASFE